MGRKRKRQLEDNDRVRLLHERVKQGNLNYFDPLVDGKLIEFSSTLQRCYKGFKV